MDSSLRQRKSKRSAEGKARHDRRQAVERLNHNVVKSSTTTALPTLMSATTTTGNTTAGLVNGTTAIFTGIATTTSTLPSIITQTLPTTTIITSLDAAGQPVLATSTGLVTIVGPPPATATPSQNVIVANNGAFTLVIEVQSPSAVASSYTLNAAGVPLVPGTVAYNGTTYVDGIAQPTVDPALIPSETPLPTTLIPPSQESANPSAMPAGSGSSTLSPGAIAGISIGAFAALALLLLGLIFLFLRARKDSNEDEARDMMAPSARADPYAAGAAGGLAGGAGGAQSSGGEFVDYEGDDDGANDGPMMRQSGRGEVY